LVTAERLSLSCDEVDELAAAYVLAALPPDEAIALEEHADSCTLRDHATLREFAETASMLSLLVTPAAPPHGLEDRILQAALAEVGGSSERGRTVVPFRRQARPWLPFALAAAALAVLAVGLASWGLYERDALLSARQAQQHQAAMLALLQSAGPVLQTPSTDSIPTGILIEPKGGSGPSFYLMSWPSPPQGRTYQAWYIAGGRPVSAGVFGGSPDGLQVVQLAPLAPAAQAFAVTVEPAGGSAQPTTEPLFVRPLTSS
jgi:anti-sigma-K factor RskA